MRVGTSGKFDSRAELVQFAWTRRMAGLTHKRIAKLAGVTKNVVVNIIAKRAGTKPECHRAYY